MTILELALIDIRNFKEVKKIIFKPGMNIIHGGNGSGKTTLFEVLSHLLSPSYPPYSETRSSQAAILFKMKNGGVYRLLRNFSKRTSHLYQLDNAKKLALVEQEEQGVQSRLNSILNGDETLREATLPCFFLDGLSLPSRRPHPMIENSEPMNAIRPPTEGNDLSKEKTQDRLAELKKQLTLADAVAQKESEMLDDKDRVYSLKRILNDLDAIEAELAGITEKGKEFSGFESIPGDIKATIEDYEKSLGEKNSEEQELIEEKEIIEQQLVLDQQTLVQNKWLWAGSGLVLAAIAAGVVMDLEGLFKNLDFAGLLTGFGLIVFALIDDFRRISQKKIWKGKLDNKNKNLEMLDARFKREHAKYFDALEKTGSPDKETFETRLSDFLQLREDERGLLSRKERLLEEKTKESIQAEINEANEKINSLEKEINQLKPGSGDPYVIQNEIKILEEQLSAEDSFSSLDSPPSNPSIQKDFSAPSRFISSFLEKDWPLILKTGSLTPEQAGDMIQKKFALCAGNQFKLKVSEQGSLAFNQDLETMSPGTLDHIFLSLCLVRTDLFQNIPIPFFLDDPFITLDPSRQSLILNGLKTLDAARQIILFSNSVYPVDTANIIKL
ncbi:MAG: ATP-binding protein [Nitrospiria bacterium]